MHRISRIWFSRNVACAIAVFLAAASGAEACPDISARAWARDAEFLAEQIKQIHPEPFWAISERAFDAEVARFGRNVRRYDACEAVIGLNRLISLLQDGHLFLDSLSVADHDRFYLYPIEVYEFSDGLYVLAAAADYADAIGAKITQIGNTPAAQAWARIVDNTEGDNRQSRRSIARYRLQEPFVIQGLGLSDRRDALSIAYEKPGGATGRIEINAISRSDTETLEWIWGRPRVGPDGPVAYRDRIEELDEHVIGQSFTQFPNKFWRAAIPEIDALYVKINSTTNKENQTLQQFTEETFDDLDEIEAGVLIVDISHNGGGNGALTLPFLHEIIKRDRINRRGALFVVIGRNTFSAAQIFTGFLRRHTQALFVGEPTGGNPIHYGETTPVELPESKLVVGVSTNRYQNAWPSSRGLREGVPPDIAAEYSGQDHFSNRDVIMQAIADYIRNPVEPLGDVLRPLLRAGDLDAARRAYSAYKENHPDRIGITTESEINSLGYAMIAEGNLPAALLVFELNARSYPNSSNVWDSLGEARFRAQDYAAAVSAYERSIELDPENANARRMIAQMRALMMEGDRN